MPELESRPSRNTRLILDGASRSAPIDMNRALFSPWWRRLVPERDDAVHLYLARFHANGVPRGPVRMMHRGCRDPRPYDAAMIGTAITAQPERTGPDWFGKVATRALNPLKPGYASAVGATAIQAYPSAARWRFPGGPLEPGRATPAPPGARACGRCHRGRAEPGMPHRLSERLTVRGRPAF
jgi:hypothetical protein